MDVNDPAFDQRTNEDTIVQFDDVLLTSKESSESCTPSFSDQIKDSTRLSNIVESRPPPKLEKQSAGCSISERPLVLGNADCNSININKMTVTETRQSTLMDFGSVMRKLRLKSTVETARKQQILNGECNANNKSNNDSSTALSLNLLSWKESAACVVESIRERLGSFRKARSLENSEKGAEKDVETASPIKRYRIGGLRNMSTEGKENLEKNNLTDTKATFNIATNKVNIGLTISSENTSTYFDSSEINEATASQIKPISSSPSCTKFPLSIDDQENVDIDGNTLKKPTITAFCSPCLGSVESVYDNNLPKILNTTETQSENITNFKLETVDCGVIVIEDQASDLSESHDVTTTYPSATGNHTKMRLPHNLITGSSLSTSEETADTMIQNNKFNNNEDNKSSSNSSIQDDEGVQLLPQDEKRECAIPTKGMNLWDLRNSLECNEIDIRNARDRLEMHEGSDNDYRRISLNTDCGTEHSPRSTPSSERLISRGLASSESEEERINQESCSPRQSDRQTSSSWKLEGSPTIYNDKTLKQYKEGHRPDVRRSDPDIGTPSNTKPVNVIVTTAIIERSPALLCCPMSEGVNNQAGNQSVKKSTIPASDRRRQFSFNKMRAGTTRVDNTHPAEINAYADNACLINKERKDSKSNLTLPLTPQQKRKPMESNISKTSSESDKVSCKIDKLKSHQKANLEKIYKDTSTKHNPMLHRGESTSSDDVFLSDQRSPISSDSASPRGQKLYSRESVTRPQNFDDYRNTISPYYGHDQTSIAPSYRYYGNQRCKYTTKPESTTSSGASSPTSPSPSSMKIFGIGRRGKSSRSSKSESNDSLSSHSSSSRGSSGMRSFSRLFRRSNTTKNPRMEYQSPTFCGYTMDRDYCVDSETDRIFKTFLCQETSASEPSLITPASSEPFPPPSHMLPPRPLNRLSETQLRRQVMKKQYSDSIAMYYGQRMRRWRFTKQKSDSVNCPVDRGTLRRQDRIEEEFDPEEINERLSSSSSSRKQSIPPTVHELKEWRRASLRRISLSNSSNHSVLKQAHSLPTSSSAYVSRSSIKRVTFQNSEDQTLPTDESPVTSHRTMSSS